MTIFGFLIFDLYDLVLLFAQPRNFMASLNPKFGFLYYVRPGGGSTDLESPPG